MREIIEIHLDSINILNPRERDPARFKENVDSIARVGLKRPVVVNTRFLAETSKYELVCGQGRIEAVKKLGWMTIPALTVDVDRETALIMSIAENAARHSPPPLWFAKVVKGLNDNGMTLNEIAAVIGKSIVSVRSYLTLLNQGEETLLHAVESGRIPVSLAVEIAAAPDLDQQTLLLKAYESGTINGKDLSAARRLIDNRRRYGKGFPNQRGGQSPTKPMTLEDLRRKIKQTLVKQEEFVKKSQRAENRLALLAEEFSRLNRDSDWRELLAGESLLDFPKLKGESLKYLFDFNEMED
jgi:ParB family chromosome partitioning protein